MTIPLWCKPLTLGCMLGCLWCWSPILDYQSKMTFNHLSPVTHWVFLKIKSLSISAWAFVMLSIFCSCFCCLWSLYNTSNFCLLQGRTQGHCGYACHPGNRFWWSRCSSSKVSNLLSLLSLSIPDQNYTYSAKVSLVSVCDLGSGVVWELGDCRWDSKAGFGVKKVHIIKIWGPFLLIIHSSRSWIIWNYTDLMLLSKIWFQLVTTQFMKTFSIPLWFVTGNSGLIFSVRIISIDTPFISSYIHSLLEWSLPPDHQNHQCKSLLVVLRWFQGGC